MTLTLHDFTLSALEFLPYLLKAYWILASSSVLLTLLPLPIPEAFKTAVRLAAARGKLWHDRPATRCLGPLTSASVPQQYFEHFYLVGVLATTALLQTYVFVCCSEDAQRDSLLALLLFEIHVMRRYYETNYVMHYPESARMHLLAYLFGLSYYLVVPLTLLPAGVMRREVVRSAWEQAVGAGVGHWQSVDRRLLEAVTAPHPGAARLAAGAALFLAASLLQYRTHLALGRLARAGEQRSAQAAAAAVLFRRGDGSSSSISSKSGSSSKGRGEGAAGAGAAAGGAATEVYSIPKGGAFELVSCPHYLAEILIYVALAVVTRGSVGALLIAAWVALNLVLAAGATQRWYRTRFPDYPSRRAALLPWVF